MIMVDLYISDLIVVISDNIFMCCLFAVVFVPRIPCACSDIMF